MKRFPFAVLALGAAGAAGALAYAADRSEPPPVAVYWVSASTTSGFMSGMMGANGGRPSMGALMGMMARGGPDPNAAQHSLRLQLGSLRKPTGEAQAEHDAPDGLGAGPVLPLVSPRPVAGPPPAEEEQPQPPEQYRKPQGRMLIFWGCGEHVGAGQPLVIDFAKMADSPMRYAGLMRGLNIAPMRPPSAGRYATYGEWPNARDSQTIPGQGSLVGPHVIKSDYAPEIRFTLSQRQDFMAPLVLTDNAPTPSGAVRLAWRPIPTALGYFASAIGGEGGSGRGGGGSGGTVVMWTSSAAQTAAFAAPDYLSPGETRRLVADKALLAPQTTTCTVPQEVIQAAPHAMLSMTAYGEEANFAYPERPAAPVWVAKVRYRSATSALLGQADPTGGGRGQQNQRDRSPWSGLGGLLPH